MWTDVKTSLPANYKRVLAICGDVKIAVVCYYVHEDQTWRDEYHNQKLLALHPKKWMLFPEELME